MKIISALICLLFVIHAYCFDEVGTHLIIDGNHLCMKSLSRSKCSSDSFTQSQIENMNKKIKAIKARLPSYIVNDVLNNFWANNHRFSSSQLMSTFHKMDSSDCTSKLTLLSEGKGPIQNQMNKLSDQLRDLDKGVVRSCMNPKLANKVYPTFNIPKEFKNTSEPHIQTNQ